MLCLTSDEWFRKKVLTSNSILILSLVSKFITVPAKLHTPPPAPPHHTHPHLPLLAKNTRPTHRFPYSHPKTRTIKMLKHTKLAFPLSRCSATWQHTKSLHPPPQFYVASWSHISGIPPREARTGLPAPGRVIITHDGTLMNNNETTQTSFSSPHLRHRYIQKANWPFLHTKFILWHVVW